MEFLFWQTICFLSNVYDTTCTFFVVVLPYLQHYTCVSSDLVNVKLELSWTSCWPCPHVWRIFAVSAFIYFWKKGSKQKLVTIFGVAHLLSSGRFVSNYLSSKISFVQLFVVYILPCITFCLHQRIYKAFCRTVC